MFRKLIRRACSRNPADVSATAPARLAPPMFQQLEKRELMSAVQSVVDYAPGVTADIISSVSSQTAVAIDGATTGTSGSSALMSMSVLVTFDQNTANPINKPV